MRNELELIKLIEQYLRNELNETDRAQFEARLQTDTRLQEEVALQRDLMAGMQRLGIRHEVQQAYRKYRSGKNGWQWGLGGLLVIAGIVALLYYSIGSERHLSYELPEFNELGETDWADADANLPYQFFTIDTDSDTVIESDGGIVVAIPAGAFLDANGQPASGKVQFEFKEALDAESILTSGLSTTSNGRLLETGGMFYLNARKEGKSLTIDTCKQLYVQVPSAKDEPGMMLFDGERMPDGSINWVNPKPQEDFLIPVDIFSLNFYPPGYLDSLRTWGYDAENKQWTDSVFYNAVCLFGNTIDFLNESVWDWALSYADSVSVVGTDSAAFVSLSYCDDGIQPSDIKAIWNERFQGTLIATKEFEQRLAYLYSDCDGGKLEVNKHFALPPRGNAMNYYVDMLREPMYKIDSVVASKLSGNLKEVFEAFAQERKGRVAIDDALAKKLSSYYDNKRIVYSKAVNMAHEKMNKERSELEAKRQKLENEDWVRKDADFTKEFELNLTEAYRQLGYNKPSNPSGRIRGNGGLVTVGVNSTGWKNVDQYVLEATLNRQSLDYTDSKGNTAKIAYEPLTVKVGYPERFERLYVYLLTPEFNSFIRVKRTDDVFKENLNELLTYHVACVGYMDGQLYFAKEVDVDAPRELIIDMRKLDEKELAGQLKGLCPKDVKTMQEELENQEFLDMFYKRKKQDVEQQIFNRKLNPVIFPCAPSCEKGERTFKALCASCHKLDAKLIGPALLNVEYRWARTPYYQGISGRDWLKRWIRNWQDPVNAGHPYSVQHQNYDASAMTHFPLLSDNDLESLLMYMGECSNEDAADVSTQGE